MLNKADEHATSSLPTLVFPTFASSRHTAATVGAYYNATASWLKKTSPRLPTVRYLNKIP